MKQGKMRILVDSIYINESGGKILLTFFIKKLIEIKIINDFYFLFDERLSSDCTLLVETNKQTVLKPSESERQNFYKKYQSNFERIFCFANVPPPSNTLKLKTFILFHNALILDTNNKNYSPITNAKFFIKRWYIKLKSRKTYTWIVQTKNMKQLVTDKLDINEDAIKIVPIYESFRFKLLNKQLVENEHNFLYVADGVKQKNHEILLNAWEIIFNTQQLPLTLHLTIPPNFEKLNARIIDMQNNGILIVNHGRCSFDELEILYSRCNYFIMPSLAESFGLPLVEAAEVGCEIVGANLDYIYDIVNPIITFDPYSAMDLANCIIKICKDKPTTKTKLIVRNEIESLINLLYK